MEMFIRLLLTIFRVILKNKTELLLELAAKDQQLAVYKRRFKRIRLKNRERRFWIVLSQIWPEWRRALIVVKPETVILWHRYGFKYFWRWKSRYKYGRPCISRDLIQLIKKISRDNPSWGNMRIRDELKFLGIEVSLNTIKKYRIKTSLPPSQTWRAFLKNHMNSTISIDMFTVPTVTFGILYGFLVIGHARRKILFTNATYNPTSQWLGQQLINAFFEEEDKEIKYLIRDRDKCYGKEFQSRAFGLDIKEIMISPHSPWQSGYVERVIGSIRREGLNNMIILGENHLRNVLREYTEYYNRCRPHQGEGMGHDSPIPRRVMKSGEVFSESHLGGFQNCYKRAA